MRLFVAVDIDDETRAQLAPAREALQRALNRAAVVPRVVWVTDDGAHATLRFIGEVSEAVGQSVQQALREPLPLEPFDVRWDHLGTFPSGRSPRVVWVGCGSGGDGLEALARAVSARVAPLVGPGESRPFKPHVTVARVKEPGTGVGWSQAIAAAPFTPSVTRVDHATLYLSRTSPKGPIYTALHRTSLEL